MMAFNLDRELRAELKNQGIEVSKCMRYYSQLVEYVLADPPRNREELSALIDFMAFVMLKYEQLEFVPGFCYIICLGGEAMLKKYRSGMSRMDAIRYGLSYRNWRKCKHRFKPS